MKEERNYSECQEAALSPVREHFLTTPADWWAGATHCWDMDRPPAIKGLLICRGYCKCPVCFDFLSHFTQRLSAHSEHPACFSPGRGTKGRTAFECLRILL